MRKTSAMVEAGILAAIATVMALVTTYVPVLGALVVFVWPLPIIICGIRHGLKWSIMSLAVAGALIAMIISPMQSFLLVAILGLMGLIIGYSMRQHLSPLKLMLYGTLAGILSVVINMAISFLIMGINPVEMMFSSFGDGLVTLETFQRSHGIDEAAIAQSVANYKEMLRMMRIIMPAAFFLSAPVMAFVNYWAAKKVMSRLGESYDDFPPFRLLKLPLSLMVLFVVSLAGVTYYYKYHQDSWIYNLFVNVQMLCCFLLILQGIAIIYWAVDHYKKPKWWAHVAVTLMFFVPLVSQLLVYVGALDYVIDMRKIRNYKHFR